jgi:hypothetical protein
MLEHATGHTLGTLLVPLRGSNYCDALLLAGERARLVPEGDNPHDSNAIRVENSGGQKTGYVPRRVTAWLGPLLDEKRVTISARGHGREARKAAASVLMELWPTARGRQSLEVRPPENTLQALHQAVLQAWLQARDSTDAVHIAETGRRLQALEQQRLLPETRLLLALFPGMAEAAREDVAEGALLEVRRALHSLKWGLPLHHHNLTIFPAFNNNNGDTSPYLLLSDALALGKAEVREVSAQGSVPELRLHNQADLPILVPEGALLVGAKQNRVVNITLLAPARADILIPVSCVEQGRWHSVSDTFAAQNFAPPRLRANKLASVDHGMNGNGRRSDQGRVWEDVHACLNRAEARSETDSLTEAFVRTRERRRSYESALQLPADAAGAVVLSGERVLGLDLFDSARSFQTLWPRLADGYYLEASGSEEACAAPAHAVVEAFMQRVAVALRPVRQPVGVGQEFRVVDFGLAGAAVAYEDRLCHLAAFSLVQ